MTWMSKAVPALAGAALGVVAATSLAAQEARPVPSTAGSVIRVTATGEARVPPDRAWVDLGVETEAVTAREAAAENARRMEAIIAALVRAGVPRGDIETSGYNVFPDYAPPEPGREAETPRIRGYRVANTVTARTDDVQRVGAILDAALAAGGNRVNGIRFGLRDAAAARAEALRDALRRGRADAEVLAQGLNVQLGPVLEAGTTFAGGGPRPVEMVMEASAARAQFDVPTPVLAGEQLVTATVLVVYAIR